MLTAIKGYYDNGKVVLKEDPLLTKKTEVIVTFLTEEKKTEPKKRKLGLLQGQASIPDDFNEPLDDLKDYI